MALTRRQNCARNAPKAPAAEKIGSSATNSGKIPSPQHPKRAPKATKAARRASKVRKAKNTGSKLGKMTPPKRAPRARKAGNSAKPLSTSRSTRAQRLTARATRSNSHQANPLSNGISDREQRQQDREKNKIVQEFAAFRRHVDQTVVSAGTNENLLVRGLTMLLEEADNLHFAHHPEFRASVEREKFEVAALLSFFRERQERHREIERRGIERMMFGALPRGNLVVLF